MSFHDAFQRLLQEKLDEGFTEDQFRAGGKASKQWPNKEDKEWWLENGPLMVDRWVEWRDNNPGYRVLDVDGEPAIELKLTATFEGVEVRAYIDRVMVSPEGLAGVVDLKTGRDPQHTLQLGLYKLIVEQCIGVHISWGAYFLARKGGLNPVSLEHYTETYWANQIRQVRDGKEARRFLPTVDQHCTYCPVRKACPAVTGAIDPDLFKENGDPVL